MTEAGSMLVRMVDFLKSQGGYYQACLQPHHGDNNPGTDGPRASSSIIEPGASCADTERNGERSGVVYVLINLGAWPTPSRCAASKLTDHGIALDRG